MSANHLTTCPHCGQQFPLKKAFENTAAAAFEETPPRLPKASFWQSDGVVYALAGAATGTFALLAGSWYELESAGMIAAGLSIVTGLVLHVLKIMLHAPARPIAPKPDTVTIRIEQTGTDENPRGVKLDTLADGITLDELRRVAGAIEAGHNFSRPALVLHARISQNKYAKIKGEFERLGYCYTDPGNRTHLLRAGKAFLRQISQ